MNVPIPSATLYFIPKVFDAPKRMMKANVLLVCGVLELVYILGGKGGHGNPPEDLRDLLP